MRVLVFGAGGMLGHKLMQVLRSNHEVFGTVRTRLNSSTLLRRTTGSPPEFRWTIPTRSGGRSKQSKPDVVINAIGIIKQLPDSKNVITTLTVNSIFPHRLAELGKEFGFQAHHDQHGLRLFGSRGNYSEDDIPDAVDLYGKSKNLGEVSATTV